MSVDFLDSNIFVYLFDRDNPHRSARAREVIDHAIRGGSGIISYQVVQECLNVITHKMAQPVTGSDAMAFLEAVLMPMWRVYPTDALYRRAIQIKDRYRLGFYDSLIVASALDSGCRRLLTEEMQDGQQIEGLRIVNPFALRD